MATGKSKRRVKRMIATQRLTRSQTLGSRMALRNQKLSTLLQIPPELRNIIYSYVLKGHQWAVVQPCDCHKPRHDDIALLRFCRQVHAESALLAYTLDTFFLRDINTNIKEINAFLAARSVPQLQVMRSISLGYSKSAASEDAKFQGFSFLDKMPHLRTLNIQHNGYRSRVRVNGNDLQVLTRSRHGTRPIIRTLESH
ncbi:hypothetical protein EK21DRAFT_106840 [Setomelanomma holmii]|uniref:F-box domain-containing protein n=1 Tax=Setomelanomma holmii TaxID=210430 RepID=A0A9P4HML8_9PLEO|nr:hypothetical protein EK21DRAFT_106840 [Setomelanomma holmii]